MVLQVHFARSGIGMDESHVVQFASAFAELFNHGALIGFRHLDGQFFIGFEDFVPLPVDNHFRLRHLQLVSFPAHLFDQDAEMQLAAAGHEELIRTIRFLRAQRHVGFEFFEESIAQMPRGQVPAFPSGERAIVHGEGHLDGWFVDRDSGQCDRMFRVESNTTRSQSMTARRWGNPGARRSG